ncbi:hypothetical protein E2320_016964, partial [Naja naja]
VPVAHCLGPVGHYKRKFCSVCRKQLESPAFRCEVCEIHVHTDCAPFACSDCRQCHQDGHQNHAHAACCVIVPPECTFGRLRNMILPQLCAIILPELQ